MARGRRTSSYLATAAIASALLSVVAGSGGCEVIVGHDLPAFACDQGADVCPAGEVCDWVTTHQCVAFCEKTGCASGTSCDTNSHFCVPVDAAPPGQDVVVNEASDASMGNDGDATSRGDEDAPVVPDGPPADQVGPCNTVGCPCSGPSSCASGVCADQLTVTQSPSPNLYTAAGNTNFCTRPCCTSRDCDEGTVCVATGVGGTYCVPPQWIGRSTTLGTGEGGSSCSSNAQCRSGLCNGSTCADTCCSTSGSSSECAGGTVCRFGTFPGAVSFDKVDTAWCGQGGNGQNGATCSRATDCESNLCDSNFNGNCRNACRNTADCNQGGGPQSVSCAYISMMGGGNVIMAACFPGAGNAPEGASCSSDNQCQSQFCSTNSNMCTDVCFSDADCTKTGWKCRPEQFTLQGGGSYKVLACGM